MTFLTILIPREVTLYAVSNILFAAGRLLRVTKTSHLLDKKWPSRNLTFILPYGPPAKNCGAAWMTMSIATLSTFFTHKEKANAIEKFIPDDETIE